MKVKLRFFASWREIVGEEEIEWSLGDSQNVEGLVTELIAKYPRLIGTALNSLVMVNRRYTDRQATLRSGDEVAFIPPVGGG
ncbi:MAG: MoaD/ThiS family protein [Chloroflexota bacterium]|nr:MoaD/ThiS family protein [Chloroflexota bacterium]